MVHTPDKSRLESDSPKLDNVTALLDLTGHPLLLLLHSPEETRAAVQILISKPCCNESEATLCFPMT